MSTNTFKGALCFLLLGFVLQGYSQDNEQKAHRIGDLETFRKQMGVEGKPRQNLDSDIKRHIGLPIPDGDTLAAIAHTEKVSMGTRHLIGNLQTGSNTSFHLFFDDTKASGHVILRDKNKAYGYFSDQKGQVYVKQEDINNFLCIKYERHKSEQNNSKTPQSSDAPVMEADTVSADKLESLPGAGKVIMLDFDGDTVENTSWNNGDDEPNSIEAPPTSFTDNEKRDIWRLVSEDFLPFELNVTTNEAVFQAAPQNRRMRVIFTPNDTASPGAGGVAFLGSFYWSDNTPCWVFNQGDMGAAEAASHEAGHTFDLEHDGTSSSGYYTGHGNWAPIMGAGYYSDIVQWSRGEYADANNHENDISIIADGHSHPYYDIAGIGLRVDNHPDTRSSAAALSHDGSGTVETTNNNGVIADTSERDLFEFSAADGNIDLTISSSAKYPNLDIKARLLDNNGNEVMNSNPSGNLSAALNGSVTSGTYYVEVAGTGDGDPATDGYSDYGSLGQYTISGTIPPQPTPVKFTNFNAARQQNTVRLSWQTTQERNNNYFVVQRSTDQNDFKAIDTVQGSGNSNAVLSYESVDRNPVKGTGYYRIKQVDEDGSSDFSNIVSVAYSPGLALDVYPNPAGGRFTVQVEGNTTGANIKLKDTYGRTLRSEALDSDQHSMQIQQPLQPGVYFIQALSEEKQLSKRVVVR